MLTALELRELRQFKGLSLRELERAGYPKSSSSLCQIENGKVPLSVKNSNEILKYMNIAFAKKWNEERLKRTNDIERKSAN